MVTMLMFPFNTVSTVAQLGPGTNVPAWYVFECDGSAVHTRHCLQLFGDAFRGGLRFAYERTLLATQAALTI